MADIEAELGIEVDREDHQGAHSRIYLPLPPLLGGGGSLSEVTRGSKYPEQWFKIPRTGHSVVGPQAPTAGSCRIFGSGI